MPEERVAKFIAARIEQARGETRFAAMRKRLGLSQRELTHRSGVSLRSIQMREQRNKDINRAQACSAAALSASRIAPWRIYLRLRWPTLQCGWARGREPSLVSPRGCNLKW